ncbi:olfactory receptor 5AR1-like [Pelodytes ibericus]
MLSENSYNGTGFVIRGLTDIPELKVPLFITFLLVYFMILFGNLTVFVTILGVSRLHTPMYIFLANLSLIDISCTSDIIPNMLQNLLMPSKIIPLVGCVIQMYIFLFSTCMEFCLLSAMAYDRYVAICHPLRYAIFMSLRYTIALATISWVIGLLHPITHTVLISKLSFCSSHLIDHYFCDLTPLLTLSCSDTSLIEIVTYINCACILLPAFLLSLISYIFIILTVLKIKSTEGRKKAFSTCSSHLISINLFYWTIICLYMRPTSSYSLHQDKYFSLLFTILVPLLNPVIYSLKNQDVKNALKKMYLKRVY